LLSASCKKAVRERFSNFAALKRSAFISVILSVLVFLCEGGQLHGQLFSNATNSAADEMTYITSIPDAAIPELNETNLPDEYKIRIKTRCQGSEIVFFPAQPIRLTTVFQGDVRLKFPCRDFPLPEAQLSSSCLRGPPASFC
jgi:hypothetical protein